MTIIEAIKTYLETYSGLSGGKLHVDFLPEAAAEYSIDSIPTEPVQKQYMRGPAAKQFLFVISSREYWSQDIAQNINNHAFFEAFAGWVDTQNRAHNLPTLRSNQAATRVKVLSTPYPLIVTEDGKARYQIQCRLDYYEK